MKKFVYKTAYRTVSWLNDRLGGLAILTRWKVALAAVILGFSTTILPGCNPESTCYEQVECYDPAPTCYIAPEGSYPGEGDDENGGGSETTASFPQTDTNA